LVSDGRYIAATRCLLQDYEPYCELESEVVLIDVEEMRFDALDLSTWTTNWTLSSAVAWSPARSQLLLLVRESPTTEPVEFTRARSYYLTYSPEEDVFQELKIDGVVLEWSSSAVVIDWGRSTSELLIERVDLDQIMAGWISLADGQFQAETSIPEIIAYEAKTFSAVSGLVLSGDSQFTSMCQEILSYRIASGGAFSTAIPLACFPAFSQDGGRLAYVAKANTEARPTRLMIANADGSNPTPLFSQDLPKIITYPTWSPDGSQIAFTYGAEAGANAVYVVEVPEDLRPAGLP